MRQGTKSAPEALTFVPLPEPTAHDVQRLCERTAARIERSLRPMGRYLEAPDAEPQQDPLQLEQPALTACLMAAASGRARLGLDKPPLRVMAAAASSPAPSRALCAVARGVNIAAGRAMASFLRGRQAPTGDQKPWLFASAFGEARPSDRNHLTFSPAAEPYPNTDEGGLRQLE